MSEYLRIEARGRRVTVTLNRPELHNALNDAMMNEISDVFTSLSGDGGVRVIILSAAGKSFCAGADVNWMRRMVGYSFAENVADAKVLARMLRAIRDCAKPVIARIHGAAIGGGIGLVAACDVAVAVAPAVFCLSEVKLGIIPAVISPFVLEKIGPGHARRYALTAERFDASEAHRIGLISHVVENETELDTWVASICEVLEGNGPLALAACKRVLTDVAGLQWDRVQDLTAERISQLRVSPEGQEGLKAFLEKRRPSWAP